MCVTQDVGGLVECVSFPVFSGEVQNMDREVKKCLTEAFKKTDDEFLQLASACTPSWKDGSTAVAILVVNDVIYAAGIGDSKAVLCREGTDGELTPVLLTKDHSPVVVRVCVCLCVCICTCACPLSTSSCACMSIGAGLLPPFSMKREQESRKLAAL